MKKEEGQSGNPVPEFEQSEEPRALGDTLPRNLLERLFLLYRPVAPFFFLASLCLLAFVIFTTLSGGKKDLSTPEPSKSEQQEIMVAESDAYLAEDLRREADLREALIEARGGRLSIDSLRSKKMNGVVRYRGEENDFFILAMKPDRAVVRILKEEEQVSMGYDGAKFWKVLDPQNEPRFAEEPDEFDRNMIQSMGRISEPLLSLFIEGRGRVVAVDDGKFEDIATIRVAFTDGSGDTYDEVDLAASDLSLLRWERQDESGNVHILRYGGYEEFDDFRHPTQIEYWKNGEKEFVASMDDVAFNFGAVQVLFQDPLQKSLSR